MQECKLNHLNINAVEYCGTRPSGGICQLEILKNEGMKYDSFLLEIGCGPLMMGIPAMSYLDKNHYYDQLGIDELSRQKGYQEFV